MIDTSVPGGVSGAGRAGSTETGAAGPPEEEPGRARRLLRGVGMAAIVLVLLLAVVVTVAEVLSVQVEGGSMLPTLRTGQRLLPEPGTGGQAHRFDLVLLQRPGRGEVLVKRVIGLPGDRVQIVSTPADPYQVLVQPGGRGPWYRVGVDGWATQAHRASACCAADGTRTNVATAQTVPAGEFFYLGDDPDGSQDSRAFGWGEIRLVRGRVWVRIWPPSAPSGFAGHPRLEPVTQPAG